MEIMSETVLLPAYDIARFPARKWGKARSRPNRESIRAQVKRADKHKEPRKVPEDHRLCPVCHIKIVQMRAPHCFACAPRNPDMDEVTRMIKGGRTDPRRTLAQLDDAKRAKVIEQTFDTA